MKHPLAGNFSMLSPGGRIPDRPIDDRLVYDVQTRRHALPAVALAQELGFFSLLSQSPLPIAELAIALEIESRACDVVATVCLALGFLQRQADSSLAVTEPTRMYLLPSSAFYYGPLLPPDEPALSALRRAVRETDRTGEQIAVNIRSLPLDHVRAFIHRMHVISLPAATALAQQLVFASIRRLLDVGGGSGSLSCAIAQANEDLTSTLMDVAPVCEVAREFIEGYGLGNRVQCLSADMLQEPWPIGYDAVLFGNIFHDWDHDTCRMLAKSAADALKPGGLVLLHEMLLDESRDGPLTVACFSVNMLLYERGRQYTATELYELLEQAGFTDFSSTPTFGYYSLLKARKA